MNSLQYRKLFISQTWFILSLCIPLYFGLISLYYSFSQAYIVQDDVRHHVVWLQQFVDPDLFPQDIIANYFQTVAPMGYKLFYWFMAQVGLSPIILAKLLPTGLGLITSIYSYKLSLTILPIPLGGFLSTLILNQHLWLSDNLITATPRAFFYPWFVAFLYYLVKERLILCLMAIALQGLFFPPAMVLALAVLSVRLLTWQGQRPRLSTDPRRYQVWLLGVGVAAIILFSYRNNISQMGPLVTVDHMKAMPEFGRYGRNEYFGVSWIDFIFHGRSGVRIPWLPSSILAGLMLPFISVKLRLPYRTNPNVQILYQVILASLSIYLLAHLLLFRLYFPSRYTYHSFRIVLALSAGIVYTILLDAGWGWIQKQRQAHRAFSQKTQLFMVGAALFALIELTVPAIPSVSLVFQNWVVGGTPEIYAYLAKQPKDTLVASIAEEGNNIPAFSQRSTLVGREFSSAFYLNYYADVQERIVDLLSAQYTTEKVTLRNVIRKYNIDFFLIEDTAFEAEYLFNRNWLIHSSFKSKVEDIIQQLQTEDRISILSQSQDTCVNARSNQLSLINAHCIENLLLKNPVPDITGES